MASRSNRKITVNRVIIGTLANWFNSYLQNRRQRVVIPGTKSEWNVINAGVPQGSILGPLLFLIYTNDMVNDIQSNIRLFADDTSLYIVVEDPHEAGQLLQSDIDRITDWSSKWLVKFNPAKQNPCSYLVKSTNLSILSCIC